MMLSDAALRPDDRRLAAVERAWLNLTSPGPILTAGQRQRVIAVARAAWAGAAEPGSATDMLGEAAHWLAVDAGGISAEIVGGLEVRGLDRFAYLEVSGVVARLANVDFYARGLGASLPALPTAAELPPTGEIRADATITDSWVPMLGGAIAPFVLDALPSEGEALRDLHEPMYIAMEALGDFSCADELTRVQIEWVAAKTSYLNECFY